MNTNPLYRGPLGNVVTSRPSKKTATLAQFQRIYPGAIVRLKEEVYVNPTTGRTDLHLFRPIVDYACGRIVGWGTQLLEAGESPPEDTPFLGLYDDESLVGE